VRRILANNFAPEKNSDSTVLIPGSSEFIVASTDTICLLIEIDEDEAKIVF
jgi:hypothetical protein